MLHALHKKQKKIQRVSDLITEYDEDEDLNTNPNPALQDFIQKLKVILNRENEITRKDRPNYSNSKSNRTDNVSPSSSSSSLINVDGSSISPKVIEALGNHVVLTEIFKFGSYGDLNNFRLINKQCKGIANSAIIQKRLWKLSLNDKFSKLNSYRNKALSELNDCIEASGGSFPLTTLDFSNVDDYNSWNGAAFLRFYALIEPSIKHVIFNNFGPLTVKKFQDLLVQKIPNVDHIDAGKVVFTNKKNWRLQLLLPYLKSIRFVKGEPNPDATFIVQRYYKIILLAATNLKELFDFPLELTDVAIETGKMGCIQKFNIAVESLGLMNCSPLYIKFSHTEPKLTSVTITRNPCSPDGDFSLPPELAPSLKRILISSKDTLKQLQCVPRFFPVDFQIPKFPNLEFLTVIDSNDWDPYEVGPPCVFPAGCDCSEIFRNVHTVTLDVVLEYRETLFKYFSIQVFPSVKILEFQGNFQLGRSLTTNFPNVSHIKIIDYERAISSIYREDIPDGVFRSNEMDNQIESLELHQCVLARARQEYHLDSLFTGVPTYAVTNLLGMHKDSKVIKGDENIEFDRVKQILKVIQTQEYAFRNSKGLRRIKIIFNHSKNAFFPMFNNPDSDLDWHADEVEPLTPAISLVSCVYGFSLMPKLEQVIIGYDHHLPNASDIAEVFKPFSQFPYVKIIHEPTIIRSSRND